jgi:hypothetical protein
MNLLKAFLLLSSFFVSTFSSDNLEDIEPKKVIKRPLPLLLKAEPEEKDISTKVTFSPSIVIPLSPNFGHEKSDDENNEIIPIDQKARIPGRSFICSPLQLLSIKSESKDFFVWV